MHLLCLSLLALVETSSAVAPTRTASTSSTAAPEAPEEAILIGGPAEGPVEAPAPTSARLGVRLESRFGLDPRFDLAEENVAELGLGARLELEVELGSRLKAHAAPQLYWVYALSEDGEGRAFTFLTPPEAYVSWAVGAFDLRAGYLLFNWGASDLVGPSDVLNPYDYRRNFVAALDDAKIPVPAVQLSTRLGPFSAKVVVEPVFVASRFYLFRWDTALLQPGLVQSLRFDGIAALLGEETLDEVGDQLLVTEQPKDSPENATLAARLSLALDDLDLSLTLVHGWEPLPQVYAHPDLLALGALFADAVANRHELMLSSEALAHLGNVQDALRRGEPLFTGSFGRRDVIGGDAVWALDPFVLKADVAYSFARTAYTQDNRPVRRPWLNAVLGLEYFDGESLQLVVEGFALTVLELRSNERLSLFEPRAPPPSTLDVGRRTIAVPGLAGFLRYSMLDGDLRMDVAAVATLSRGDLLLSPSVHYKLDDAQELVLGATLVEGQEDGYGGIYSHDDQIWVQYVWTR